MPDSTSKINPRKFFGMGPGPLEKRVAGNEKKITLLKNILKAQQITIGEQLQSLSSGTFSVFPSKSLTTCSEQVGHFDFTYAFFRHIFAQMEAYLQTLSFLSVILTGLF